MFFGCQGFCRAREFRARRSGGNWDVERAWAGHGLIMGSRIAARHQSDDSLCRRPGPAPRCRSFGTAIPGLARPQGTVRRPPFSGTLHS